MAEDKFQNIESASKEKRRCFLQYYTVKVVDNVSFLSLENVIRSKFSILCASI